MRGTVAADKKTDRQSLMAGMTAVMVVGSIAILGICGLEITWKHAWHVQLYGDLK